MISWLVRRSFVRPFAHSLARLGWLAGWLVDWFAG